MVRIWEPQAGLQSKAESLCDPIGASTLCPLVFIRETTEAWRGEVTIPRSQGRYSSPSDSSL